MVALDFVTDHLYGDLTDNTYKAPMAPKSKKSNVTKRPVRVVVRTVPKRVRDANVRAARAPTPAFGPVATIDTAPVSIGNTFGGAAPVITPIAGGQRIRARDFLFNVDNTASTVTSWTLVGGAPISPLCMVNSGIKSMMQMYSRYLIHGIAIHYITSCTTGDAGAVMLYIGKNRAEPGLITNNSNLLSVVLSDPCTVISPVWKNCSAVHHPAPEWRPTDTIGSSDGLHEQSAGEAFVYIRIPSTNVPGYILIDYDISFMEMQVNLKALSLPVSRMKYTQVRLTDAAVVANQISTYDPAVALNFLLDGTTLSTAPPGAVAGDIYKIIVNTDDGYIGVAMAAAFQQVYPIGGGSVVVAVAGYQDGATLYGVYSTANQITLYPSYYAAYSMANQLVATVASGVSGSHSFICYMSYCGSVNGTLSQSNY